ncbi:MAG: hypothetical protein ACU0GG_14960 [Paracoccaceae bacterium]
MQTIIRPLPASEEKGLSMAERERVHFEQLARDADIKRRRARRTSILRFFGLSA